MPKDVVFHSEGVVFKETAVSSSGAVPSSFAFLSRNIGAPRPLSECDMGHNPTDADDYWTQTGYARTPEQNRRWMKDPDNYEFEYGPDNRAKGGAKKNRYDNADPVGGAEIPGT